MGQITRRIAKRWFQFLDEVSGLVRGLQLLIVNLSLIGTLQPVRSYSITVVVDSVRESIILKLLSLTRLLPRHRTIVVSCNGDLDFLFKLDRRNQPLLIVTSRTFTRHYQQLADLRRQQRLVVL